MKKDEFLNELRSKLKGLTKSDIEDRISYYSEMIDDRIEEGESEEDATNNIGTVDEIVEQIATNTSLVKLVKEKTIPKRSLKAWEIILLILGFPLWFPILITGIVLAFTFYILIWVFVIVVYALELSLIAMALVGAVTFFAYLFDGSLNLIVLGASILGLGGGILLSFVCIYSTKITLKLSKKIIIAIKMSFIKKGETK